MKQRKTVRVAGPFSVEALIETYRDNSSKVLGYNIRGPGSDPHWLYSEAELATKLDELQAMMGGEKQTG
jgi:hypothetical protein